MLTFTTDCVAVQPCCLWLKMHTDFDASTDILVVET